MDLTPSFDPEGKLHSNESTSSRTRRFSESQSDAHPALPINTGQFVWISGGGRTMYNEGDDTTLISFSLRLGFF
jgi:hypothetical protein